MQIIKNIMQMTANVGFLMTASSLADAQSQEPGITTAIAGAGNVSANSINTTVEASSRRLLAASIYKARARSRPNLCIPDWQLPLLTNASLCAPPSPCK